MAHSCPWCERVLPVTEMLLGREGLCPGCRRAIRMPQSMSGRVERVGPPPFELEEDAAQHPPLEVGGEPLPERKPPPLPSIPAADGPRPGDSNWRPYLSENERTRPTRAAAGGGLVLLVVATWVCCRISCMGAQRASRGSLDVPRHVAASPSYAV